MNFCTGKIVLFLINRQSDTSRRTSTSAVFYVQYRLYLCYNMILLFVRWCYMYQWKKLFRYATQWKNYMEDWISAQERFCYLWSIVTAIAKPVSMPFLIYSTVCIIVIIVHCRLFVDVSLINEKSYSDATKNNIWRIEFLHRT